MRRVTLRQLSMRDSNRSPNSSKSCALGSGPVLLGGGRVVNWFENGPRRSLNDCFRFNQRDDGALAAYFARRVRGVRFWERSVRWESSSSSSLTTASSELFPPKEPAGVGSFVVLSDEQSVGAEPSESDWEPDGPPREGATSKGPWTYANSREALERCTQPLRCYLNV